MYTFHLCNSLYNVTKGPFINDVIQIGGMGVSLFVRQVHKALGIRACQRGSAKVQICVTSFTNDLIKVFNIPEHSVSIWDCHCLVFFTLF